MCQKHTKPFFCVNTTYDYGNFALKIDINIATSVVYLSIRNFFDFCFFLKIDYLKHYLSYSVFKIQKFVLDPKISEGTKCYLAFFEKKVGRTKCYLYGFSDYVLPTSLFSDIGIVAFF